MNKFKNKMLWVSILSIVIMILRRFGVVESSIDTINLIFDSILTILIIAGVINNPDGKENTNV